MWPSGICHWLDEILRLKLGYLSQVGELDIKIDNLNPLDSAMPALHIQWEVGRWLLFVAVWMQVPLTCRPSALWTSFIFVHSWLSVWCPCLLLLPDSYVPPFWLYLSSSDIWFWLYTLWSVDWYLVNWLAWNLMPHYCLLSLLHGLLLLACSGRSWSLSVSRSIGWVRGAGRYLCVVG